MSYCPNCKVELASDAEFCPLCLGRSEGSIDTINPVRVCVPETVRDAEEGERLSPKEQKKIAMELLTVTLSMALIVSLVADFLFFDGFSWSRYVGLILIMVWLFTYIPLLLWGRLWLVFSILGPALPAGLLLWGLFNGDLSWYLPVGLPVVLCLEVALLASTIILRVQRQRGLNVPGVLFVVAGFICAGIDATVSLFLKGSISLSWSVVVVLTVIPVAGFFFYLHFRILKQASLRKIFRL